MYSASRSIVYPTGNDLGIQAHDEQSQDARNGQLAEFYTGEHNLDDTVYNCWFLSNKITFIVYSETANIVPATMGMRIVLKMFALLFCFSTISR